MYPGRVHRCAKQLLIIVLASLAGTVSMKNSPAADSYTSVSNISNLSLKSFLNHSKRIHGTTYSANVTDLFGILLQAKGFTTPEKEISFLEFDVLKLKVVDNRTLALKVNNGDIVRMKDSCKISFTPRTVCFIYIFRIEPSGIIFPIFPRRKFSAQTNPLTPNLTYFVPPMKKWLPFGTEYGKGAIIIFASKERNHSLEKLFEYFNKSETTHRFPSPEISGNIPVINRGIGGMKKSVPRQIRLPFDEIGEFLPTEYVWDRQNIVITVWYTCR